LGSEHSVRVSSVATQALDKWTLNVQYEGPSMSSVSHSSGTFSEARVRENAQAAYVQMVPEAGSNYLESVVADARQTDAERLSALNALGRGFSFDGVSRALSTSAIQAAIELGRTAVATETRLKAWELLAQMDHPLIARALMDTLLTDMEAAI